MTRPRHTAKEKRLDTGEKRLVRTITRMAGGSGPGELSLRRQTGADRAAWCAAQRGAAAAACQDAPSRRARAPIQSGGAQRAPRSHPRRSGTPRSGLAPLLRAARHGQQFPALGQAPRGPLDSRPAHFSRCSRQRSSGLGPEGLLSRFAIHRGAALKRHDRCRQCRWRRAGHFPGVTFGALARSGRACPARAGPRPEGSVPPSHHGRVRCTAGQCQYFCSLSAVACGAGGRSPLRRAVPHRTARANRAREPWSASRSPESSGPARR